MSERILLLCVDRDDDLGRKAGVKGPVIGREAVLKAANKLGLADPEDSDFNTMFESVRIHDELVKSQKAEVVVVTGDKNVGLKSDRKIAKQLEYVLKNYKATGCMLITDGSEDEQVLPIIQSRVPILSIRKVIVKQAEQLESTYFKIKDFIEESLDNPKFSSLIFGIPAILLILLGIFGFEGLRIVVFLLGAYLFIKWFKLETHIEGVSSELKTSLSRRRLAFFVYILAVVTSVLSVYRGYTSMLDFLNIGFFEMIASFLSASIYFLWISAVIAWLGRALGRRKYRTGKLIAVPLFGFAISLVIFSATDIILRPQELPFNFILSIIIGFILIVTAVWLERK